MNLLSMNIMTWKSVCYSVTNIILLIFLSILFPNIYSELSFIQVGAEKQYLHTHECIMCIFKKEFLLLFQTYLYICYWWNNNENFNVAHTIYWSRFSIKEILWLLIIIVYFNALTLAWFFITCSYVVAGFYTS